MRTYAVCKVHAHTCLKDLAAYDLHLVALKCYRAGWKQRTHW